MSEFRVQVDVEEDRYVAHVQARRGPRCRWRDVAVDLTASGSTLLATLVALGQRARKIQRYIDEARP